MALTVVAMATALLLAVVAPAAAFIKDIKLTIKTNLPHRINGDKGDVFVLRWRTECAKQASSGEQAERDSSNHTCDASKLKFSGGFRSRVVPELDGESFSAEINNRVIGRPDVQLWFYGAGTPVEMFRPKDGYFVGDARKASVKRNGWQFHLIFKRDADLKHYKHFTLTIDLTK